MGERNTYITKAKGRVLVVAQSMAGLVHGLAAGLAAGNFVVVELAPALKGVLSDLPEDVAQRVRIARSAVGQGAVRAIMGDGDAITLGALAQRVVAWDGPIVTVQGQTSESLETGDAVFAIDLLVDEVSTSVNTAAAGGNASLMALA